MTCQTCYCIVALVWITSFTMQHGMNSSFSHKRLLFFQILSLFKSKVVVL